MSPQTETLDVAAFVRQLRAENPSARIVFTNGCFDLLHVGHIRLLEYAAKQGNVLLVGLNTDASVKAIKGKGRPIQSYEDRREILLSLWMIHGIVPIEGKTALRQVSTIKPDVYVKGADYQGFRFPESDFVIKSGGEVHLDNWTPDHSTSRIIKHILEYRDEYSANSGGFLL